MSLPYFYIDEIYASSPEIILDEDTSRHVVNVLRMKPGEEMHLTDGKGHLLSAEIINDHKKKCLVKVNHSQYIEKAARQTCIAISLLKNNSRFEWFLEKATEIGISTIIPLMCNRTERSHFRTERMKGVLVSAMLQSQQTWLPVLEEPVPFDHLLESINNHQRSFEQKWIAHCLETSRTELADAMNPSVSSQIILIGPEGDFTPDEIKRALQYQFVPVSLGNTRLRAETAGMAAAVLLKLG